MTPPLPPCLVDIRFTASRAHRMAPVTLIAIMRWMRSADISSTRTPLVPTMPALLTSAPSVPNSSAALNSARMSLSLPTSHFTAMALPFLRSICGDDLVGRRLVAGVADDDAKAARRGRDARRRGRCRGCRR